MYLSKIFSYFSRFYMINELSEIGINDYYLPYKVETDEFLEIPKPIINENSVILLGDNLNTIEVDLKKLLFFSYYGHTNLSIEIKNIDDGITLNNLIINFDVKFNNDNTLLINDELFKQLRRAPNYYINNAGVIYNVKRNKFMKHKLSDKSLGASRQINLHNTIDGYSKYYKVHRLVFEEWGNEPLNSRLVLNHINGNPSVNDISNLEQVTVLENNRHAYYTGLRPKMFTYTTINTICELLSKNYSTKEIMDKMKMPKSERVRMSNLCHNIKYHGYFKDISKKYGI